MKTKNRMRRICLLILLLVATVMNVSAASYDLVICGTRVTDANKDDLSVINGVSGTVKYNPSTKTLTLGNATMTRDIVSPIKSEIDGLTINVSGTNSISSNAKGCRIIYASGDLIINGSGTLSINGSDFESFAYGIYLDNCNLTVSGCALKVTAMAAINFFGDNHYKMSVTNDAHLDLNGYECIVGNYIYEEQSGTVTLEVLGEQTFIEANNIDLPSGRTSPCFDGISQFVFDDGIDIFEPAEPPHIGRSGMLWTVDSVFCTSVKIGPVTKYGLWFGGVPVTSANCDNIVGRYIKQGTATYDDETRTLTLTDCRIIFDKLTKGSNGIISTMDSLAIHLVGSNSIAAADTGIVSNGDLTIAGPGELGWGLCTTGISMTGNSNCDIRVTDGASLNMLLVITGIVGKTWSLRINKDKTATLYRNKLYVSGGMTDVSIMAGTSAISDINNLNLSDGLSLTAPIGAKFDNRDKHAVCDKDGNVVGNFKTVRISHQGDVNNDGAITMADANVVVNYFLATEKPSGFDLDNANVNGDTDDDGNPAITMADANAIVNMFLGQ